jgi:hypothetical protein
MGFLHREAQPEADGARTSERVNVRYHRDESIQFRDFLDGLANASVGHKRFRRAALPAPLQKREPPW